MSKIREIYKSNIVLDLQYKHGLLKDQSTQALTPTVTGSPYWKNTKLGYGIRSRSGVLLNYGTGSGNVYTCSMWIDFTKDRNRSSTAEHIIGWDNSLQRETVLGNSTGAFANEVITIWSGTGGRSGVDSATFTIKPGLRNLSYTWNAATTGYKIFLDGVRVDNATSGTQALQPIGQLFVCDGNNAGAALGTPLLDTLVSVLVFDNQALTEAELVQLYEEEGREIGTTGLPKRNFQLPELVSYPNFERDSVWTKGTGWSIANGKASSDGSQTADSDLTQAVGTVGKNYTIEYAVSNYSAGNINVIAGTQEGTDRSANGVYTEFLQAAGNTNIGLRADLDFVGDIDYIKVGEGYKPYYKNDFKDTPVTIGTSGDHLGGFKINSGTWKISDDGTDRWLECVTNGIAYIPLLRAYGTFQFDLYNNGVNSDVLFIADTVGGPTATGQDGYHVRFSSTQSLSLRESTNGSAASLSVSSGSYVAATTKYSIRVTRTAAGVFTYYVRGGAYTSWTTIDSSGAGTNPVTDTTTTSSKYFVCDIDAGDKISNIKIFEGVLSPTDFPNL